MCIPPTYLACRRGLFPCMVAVVLFNGWTRMSISEDAVDRLKMDQLRAQHEAIVELSARRNPTQVKRPYQDFRANLHVHSAFSHDSRGKIEQIVASAKAAGTNVIMFSEHPAPHYDFFLDGHQGVHDGVLMIPGAEMKGFLVYPKQNVQAFAEADKQEFSNIVRGRGGLLFVSHLEERMEWLVHGVTGCEIYNTHADFKEETRLLSLLKNPLWLIQAKKMIDAYPQEALSALLDYPEDYLKRWDELCQIHPHTGVSANDSHQNVGLVVRLVGNGKVQVEDPLGDKLLELDQAVFSVVQKIPDDTPVGTELFRLQLDPYDKSFRHVATHLLMKELNVESVWDALNAGRAYVAFDWMADATGFDWVALNRGQRFEMGSSSNWKAGETLQGTAPHPVRWKVYRNGKHAYETSGQQMVFNVEEPGIYRAEAWLELAGREQIWILSNPIYLLD
jgi:hypothetical protein